MNFAMNSGGRSWHLRAVKIIAQARQKDDFGRRAILWKKQIAFEEGLR